MRKPLAILLILYSMGCFAQPNYFITSLDGTRIFVQEFGKGKPVFVLAGGPGLKATYMDSVSKYLSLNFRCIVMDQRGTGKSILPAIDSTTISMKNYINDIDALQQFLKLDKLTLIGHSWGGMLSMAYAAKYPHRVQKLLLLNSGGPTRKFETLFQDNVTMRLRETDKDFLWAGYFFDRNKAYDNKKVFAAENLYGQDAKIFTYAAADYNSQEKERIKALKHYRGDVCLIQGRQDPVGESTAFEIKNLLAQSQIYFIEKCGHFPWMENVAQQKEFFSQVRRCLQ